MLADVDGDGKVDEVGFYADGTHVAFGNGNGTFQPGVLGSPFFGFSAEAGSWTNTVTYPRYLADVNHDGAADILAFAVTGVLVALSAGDIWG